MKLTREEYDAVNLAWKRLGQAGAREGNAVRIYEARDALWRILDDVNTGRIELADDGE